MENLNILFLLVSCIGASFVQRVSGFGFGIFIMTILPYIMPSYGESTALSGLLSAAQSLYVLTAYYKYICWKRLLPILVVFIIVSYFAVEYVSAVKDTQIKCLLGIALVLMGIYFMFVSDKIKLRPTLAVQVSMGSVSGVMGGLFGMQGPPAVLYFISSAEGDKSRYLALTQAYFLIGNLMMTAFRFKCGFVTGSVLNAWLYAIVGVVVGTYLGRLVFDRISSVLLKKIVYFYMIISGFIAFFS